MPIYRVKQFYWSITAKLTGEDIGFIHQYLEPFEIKLFNKLALDEQKHSINVAKDIKVECNLMKKTYKNNFNINKLIKVGLLHDIGKIENKLNPIDKSILVVLNNITNGKIKKYKKIKKINTYYNHAEIGYNILKELNYDDRFLYLVRNHHNKSISKDIELKILNTCDDRN